MSQSALWIKRILENEYDIPFVVNSGNHSGDVWFEIRPEGEENLFVIRIQFRNRIRLIIDVMPERYAAFSIRDMSGANEDKKDLFESYAQQMVGRKAKIEFYINDSPVNPTDSAGWPAEWHNYRMRITKSPITGEDEKPDESDIASSWAMLVTGMFLSLLNVITDEETWTEGGKKRIETNRYERNPVNRQLCLAANGYICRICGFDFERIYGELGRHYIHVHHIVPVSMSDKAYRINPVTDLLPVCPNCHAMLHRTDPPMMPDDLRTIIQEGKSLAIIDKT